MSARRELIAILAAAAALGIAGCASVTHSTTSSTTTRRSAATRTTGPTVTASSSAATTATATGSTLPGAGKPAVTIGDKNDTEQFVLGQLYLQALTAQGFTVTINQNIGPTEVTQQALRTGALAMYPEYLNTFATALARRRRAFHSRLAAYRAATGYAVPHGLVLLEPTPFADVDAIAVTVAFARDNHLSTIYDLRRVAATMAMAGPPQFATGLPGLPALSSAYGVTPETFRGMPVGAQYGALNSGAAQAAYVNSTDAQLTSGDYRLLADHRRIFGWGNIVPVVSAKALAAQGPAFAETVERVDRMLTTPVMRQLNAAVDLAHQSPAAAAKQFLQTHGLLDPLPAP